MIGASDSRRTTGFLTLDVEDWEHANFLQLTARTQEIRRAVHNRRYAMDRNIDLWINVLGEADARSTCFVLGEFAQRYPHAIRRLAAAGHEIASHSFSHDLIYRMTREQFRDQLRRGLGVLGDLVGTQPRGFRAPSWSVDERTPWFCEELEAQAIRYDSSEFPVGTPLYGQRGAPIRPYRVGGILRIPVTVLTLGPARLPFSSGAFFRLAPRSLVHFGLKRAARKRLPVMVVLHPRELDPHHPRLPLKGWEAGIHYANLKTTLPKLRSILRAFAWSPIGESAATILSSL
jgi:polysaccharide deacetylase family protein (PEP-CTERM system associated)